MRLTRLLLPILAVGVGIAFLAGAGRHNKSESGPASPAPAPVVDPAASQLVDDALAALDRIGWVETTVRLDVNLPELEYWAEGRFRAAPDNRYRLEMVTHLAKTAKPLLVVADGKSVWRATPVSDGVWKDVHCAKTGGAADVAVGQGGLLRDAAFSGPRTLLGDLRKQLIWVKREAISTDGTSLIELTGVWKPELTAKIAAKDEPWPEGVPDRCRLLLDAGNLWPRRVEWWGPVNKKGTTLLAKLELRDPVLDHAPLRAECERLFSFNPGNAPVVEPARAADTALSQ